MPNTESSPSNRDFKAELRSEFQHVDINQLPPHQFYASIVLFLAHGCPATVLLDFFYYHPDYPTLKRFMLRYPNPVIHAEINEHEEQRVRTFEKIVMMRQQIAHYTQSANIAPENYN